MPMAVYEHSVAGGYPPCVAHGHMTQPVSVPGSSGQILFTRGDNLQLEGKSLN